MDPETRQISARVIRTRKAEGRGMVRGLVYVEAYLPFDPAAFARFQAKAAELGGWDVAAGADPDLARLALDPIDAHGEAMLAQDLEALAHGFMAHSRRIDVGHDETPRSTVRIVQSFLNTAEIGSPNYFPGAWVVVLEVDPGSPEWTALENGTLNAVSFQAIVRKIPVTVRSSEAAAA